MLNIMLTHKKNYLSIILIILLSFSSSVFAFQDTHTEESIIQRLEYLANDNSIDPHEALAELGKITVLSEKNNWPQQFVEASTRAVEVYLHLENLAKSEENIQKIMPLAKKYNMQWAITRLQLAELRISDAKRIDEGVADKQNMLLAKAAREVNLKHATDIYLYVGQSYVQNNNLSDALINYRKAYRLAQNSNDSHKTAAILNSLAQVYLELNDSDMAIEYFDEALSLARRLKSKLGESIILYGLAKAYRNKNQAHQEKELLEQALNISIELKDHIGVVWTKVALAEIYLEEKRWQLALESFDEGVNLFTDSGDNRMLYKAVLGKVESLIGLGRLEKAEQIINANKQAFIETNSPSVSLRVARVLVAITKSSGRYKEALKYQERYSEIANQIYVEEQKQYAQKYRVQFGSELKENKNRMLIKDNEIKNYKIAQQETQNKYGLLIILLSVLIIVIVALMLYKQTQNRNRFKRMALMDDLTGAPNRRAILDYAQACFDEAKSTDVALSIGIIDLDFFKEVNDTFGHDVGDEVLKSFAKACSKTFRRQDRFGRYGGEEWLVVLTNTEEVYIKLIFERLSKELNGSDITGIPSNRKISFCMGVAQYIQGQDKNLQMLIARADDNLYSAKETGRNKYVL